MEWQVKLPEVLVADKRAALSIRAVTAGEGGGESDAVDTKVMYKRIPRTPVARFTYPKESDTSQQPEYRVKFKVESELPLDLVQIRNGETDHFRADLTRVRQEGARWVLEDEALVKLKAGTNTVELWADNPDGRSQPDQVELSYIPPPVVIELDRVEVQGAGGAVVQKLTPQEKNGEVVFDPAQSSLVLLVGRVPWTNSKSTGIGRSRALEVVAKVGRRLSSIAGKAAGPTRPGRGTANEREFSVPLVLIGKENRIKIEIPSISQDKASRARIPSRMRPGREENQRSCMC